MSVGRTFRARIIALVVAVALIPLLLIGFWLAQATSRSGEELLRSRLSEGLASTASDIGGRWTRQRSALLNVADDSVVQAMLVQPDTSPVADRRLRSLVSVLDAAVVSVVFVDATQRERWPRARATTAATQATTASTIPIRVPVYARASGARLGTLNIRLRLDALLPATPLAITGVGGQLGAFDGIEHRSLLPTPFDPELLRQTRFGWAGEDWRVERRAVQEPPMELVAAAPIAPFSKPFESAARQGGLLLGAVAIAALALAFLLTTRMTNSLAQLAAAADAIKGGDLDQRMHHEGDDEVGRVSAAFNRMTDSLRQTLHELSKQQSLAAVGSFASEIAHEVRNPLTSIRLDLQFVEERLSHDPGARSIQRAAIEEIDRLDRTVTGVLQLARSGQVPMRSVDLAEELRGAVRIASPFFERRGARVELIVHDPPVCILGDSGSLRQTFLNLLVNAAQALDHGGTASVSLERDGEGEGAIVTITDSGHGIDAGQLARVREPFFSTKAEGTGLGLALSQRIVEAHGGTLEIESVAGGGTTVRVRLPSNDA